MGNHLLPFRTEKLSLSAPMVLLGRPCGRVGRCRDLSLEKPADRRAFHWAGQAGAGRSGSVERGVPEKRAAESPIQRAQVVDALGIGELLIDAPCAALAADGLVGLRQGEEHIAVLGQGPCRRFQRLDGLRVASEDQQAVPRQWREYSGGIQSRRGRRRAEGVL